jgi:lipid-A-disaccharide synthase
MSSLTLAVPLDIPYSSLFFVAGEPSGDLLGSLLIKQLGLLAPLHIINGVGGEKMVEAGMNPLPIYDKLQVMGVSDVILNLPNIIEAMWMIEKKILELNPVAVVLIDYQTFNLKLAKRLRKKGYQGQIVQYVSPTVWAWKKHRIPQMEKCLDLLLTLFPFEPACFKDTSLKAVFVGHPLLEVLPKPTGNKEDLLTIFPGSRLGPIRKTLPLQIKAANRFLEEFPHFNVAISCANVEFKPYLYSQGRKLKKSPQIFSKGEQYQWMDRSKLSFATSGTVTMELAWFKTPTIVFYGLSLLNGILAKFFFKLDRIPYFSMINIMEGKEVFIEKIKSGSDPESVLVASKKQLFENSPIIEQSCQSFWNRLRPENLLTPSYKAAQEILKIL